MHDVILSSMDFIYARTTYDVPTTTQIARNRSTDIASDMLDTKGLSARELYM